MEYIIKPRAARKIYAFYGRRPRRTKNLNDNLNLNYGWSKKF